MLYKLFIFTGKQKKLAKMSLVILVVSQEI